MIESSPNSHSHNRAKMLINKINIKTTLAKGITTLFLFLFTMTAFAQNELQDIKVASLPNDEIQYRFSSLIRQLTLLPLLSITLHVSPWISLAPIVRLQVGSKTLVLV